MDGGGAEASIIGPQEAVTNDLHRNKARLGQSINLRTYVGLICCLEGSTFTHCHHGLYLLAVLRSEQPLFTMALHHRALLILWSVASWLLLASGQPQHSIHHFDNLPARLFFFEDTTVSAPCGGA